MSKHDLYLSLVENAFRQFSNLPAFSNYEGKTVTYREVELNILQLHHRFRTFGVSPRDHIALIGKNSLEWATAYLATITYGAVVVPILPNFPPADVQNLIEHSDSKILFSGNSYFEPLAISAMPKLTGVISLDDFSDLYTSTPVDSKTPDFDNEHLQVYNLHEREMMVLLYTSGTMGFSRGVMLHHLSISSNIIYARENMPLIPGDRILSFLPLAHAYGCSVEFLYPFTMGAHISFLGKLPTPTILIKAFSEIKPRLILSVPLILEKIYRKQLLPKISSPIVRLLLVLPLINKVLYKKINTTLSNFFGGNFLEIVIGGAPLNPDVQRFLKKIGFKFTIGYGMTECAPLISYAPWNTSKLNSAGRMVDRMELKIHEADKVTHVGEILVRGDNVMLGYYKNEKGTFETLDEQGWLHTGDLGCVDADGFIFIRGRSKSMILGASGQNIYPEEIEARINNLPFVAESLVVDRQGGLVALVFPDAEWIDKHHHDKAHLDKYLAHALKHLNNELADYQKISKFEIIDAEFEKTPKKSIKRFLYK